jgi:hypothetical protein
MLANDRSGGQPRGPRRGLAAAWLVVCAGLLPAVALLAQNPPQPPSDLRIVTGSGDTTPPTVSIAAPSAGATVSGSVTVTASAADNVGVAGVQFYVDGSPIGAEDTSAPYGVSWDTRSVANGSRTLTARARDAAGNQTVSAPLGVTVQNAVGALQITGVSAPGTVPRYERFEVTFSVQGTSATNLQMPYDPSPPPGIPSNWGITVNAEFSRDGFQTVHALPAFHYQSFDYQVKGNRDWFNPLDQYAWKARFAPPTEGSWQYRLTARDASGTTMSGVQTFQVTNSTNRGFVRVSAADPRYFEFENGEAFFPAGYNGGLDWFNPVLVNTSRLTRMGQHGAELSRIWLSQSGMFGSAWNPWYGLRGDYGGYIPRTGLTPVGEPQRIAMRLTYAESGGNRNTGFFEACRFIGGFQSATAVKRNTTYRFRVQYSAHDVTGPRDGAQSTYGFVLKMQNPQNGNWHTNCYDAGPGNSTGLVISPYVVSGEGVLEGEWNSGNNDYLPPFYLAIENARPTNPANGRVPAVYVHHVEIHERTASGGLAGPNIVAKPSMEHHTYFEQRFSYAFDRVLEIARQNGVYFKMVVLEKDEDILKMLDASGTFGSASAANFYGNYRSMTASRWLQQAWWRYLQARWGYSPNIFSWELVNEGDPASDRHYVLADELGKFMRQFAPNHHLVTTSFWHSLPAAAFWKNASYPNIDYVDLHAYVSTSQTSEFNAASAKDAVVRERCGTNNSCFKHSMKNDAALYHSEHALQALDRALGKPLIRGEAGLDAPNAQVEDANLARDLDGVWLHNYVWASIGPGAMTDLYWWPQNLRQRPGPDGQTSNGLYEVFLPFRDFMRGIPLNNGHYVDVAPAVSRPGDVRVFGQKDITNRRAHAWIQNRKHIWCAVVGGVDNCPYTWDGSRLSGTVTISGFAPNTSYPVQWLYFDSRGVPTTTVATSVTSNGSGQLVLQLDTLPASVTDAAVKIGTHPSSGS